MNAAATRGKPCLLATALATSRAGFSWPLSPVRIQYKTCLPLPGGGSILLCNKERQFRLQADRTYNSGVEAARLPVRGASPAPWGLHGLHLVHNSQDAVFCAHPVQDVFALSRFQLLSHRQAQFSAITKDLSRHLLSCHEPFRAHQLIKRTPT